jgi:hypothetical protein
MAVGLLKREVSDKTVALAALDVLKAIKIKHSIMTAKSFFIIQRISFKCKEMNFKFQGTVP